MRMMENTKVCIVAPRKHTNGMSYADRVNYAIQEAYDAGCESVDYITVRRSSVAKYDLIDSLRYAKNIDLVRFIMQLDGATQADIVYLCDEWYTDDDCLAIVNICKMFNHPIAYNKADLVQIAEKLKSE